MPEPTYLSASELFAMDDLEERDVFVPQWKRHVRIKALTDADRAKVTLQATVVGEIDQSRLMRFLVIASLVQPKLSAADYDRLGTKSAMAIAAIFGAINDLNKLGGEAVAEATESFPAGQPAAAEV